MAWLYLMLALFWLMLGIFVQVFWTSISSAMNIPIDRTLMGVIFFILFLYNFVRWRMTQMLQRNREEREPPRRPAPAEKLEYDPALDFTKPTPEEEKKDPPPAS